MHDTITKIMNVYIGLGGNIGDTLSTILLALKKIEQLPKVYNLRASRIYRTTPVSNIPQDPYLNAVCCFQTTFSANELMQQLQLIEASIGKKPKAKNEPRIIDLDILLFGLEQHNNQDLIIPHPHWQERLFVLKPLSDLVTEIEVPDTYSPGGIRIIDVQDLLANFPNNNNELVVEI